MIIKKRRLRDRNEFHTDDLEKYKIKAQKAKNDILEKRNAVIKENILTNSPNKVSAEIEKSTKQAQKLNGAKKFINTKTGKIVAGTALAAGALYGAKKLRDKKKREE